MADKENEPIMTVDKKEKKKMTAKEKKENKRMEKEEVKREKEERKEKFDRNGELWQFKVASLFFGLMGAFSDAVIGFLKDIEKPKSPYEEVERPIWMLEYVFESMDRQQKLRPTFNTRATTGKKKISGLRLSRSAAIYPQMPTLVNDLYPATFGITIESPEEANIHLLTKATEAFPIFQIKNAVNAYGIDASVFSIETLKTINGAMIEIRHQEPRDEASWFCTSAQGKSVKVTKYAEDQHETFLKHLQRVTAMIGKNEKVVPPPENLKFGTNLDMNDIDLWRHQYAELEKLPNGFGIFNKRSNMLNHTGRIIQGMNLAQVYIKVPHVKTPCHQENNSFCSININIGPGSCLWLGVAYEYWPKVEKMCQDRGINFMSGTYWPNPKDLRKAGIPVYEFIQKAGDMVYVSAGCVHWVKSLGYCVNVAWNVGPMTDRQMTIACKSYDYNIDARYESLVPIQTLCWNLAASDEAEITELALRSTIEHVLTKSLNKVIDMHNILKADNASIKFKPSKETDRLDTCTECQSEMFFYVFKLNSKDQRCSSCISSDDIKKNTCKIEKRYQSVQELEAIFEVFTGRPFKKSNDLKRKLTDS